ncbi:GM24894 [Drosophila sechellia]|uniref:GM24894 n=1 Tax=Drosophila sechellia TaxID=7238 RepID=B4HKK2_DROSE|nr:GM24894 [Drosophila sechellia]
MHVPEHSRLSPIESTEKDATSGWLWVLCSVQVAKWRQTIQVPRPEDIFVSPLSAALDLQMLNGSGQAARG